MNCGRLVSGLSLALLAACSVAAQEKPGNIAALEFQTPKPGMTKQYEEGRKQKIEWHKQQKDSQPLFVWETISGDYAGTYVVGRVGQHWSDFDNPSVPEAGDLDEYNKVIAAYVQALVPRYYEFLPKISNPMNTELPTKMEQIITFHVRSGKGEDFQSAITRIHDAAQKTNWPVHYAWYALVNSGAAGEFVLTLPRAKWADFEEKPDVKPFRKMLEDAFGQEEADSIIKRLDASIESEYSDIVKFRQDLSYIPAR
jgi:hypothetical protein